MTLEHVRAMLFDLDGTLIDSAPDLAQAVDAMLADLRRPLAGEEQVRYWVGNGAARLVKRALTREWDGEPQKALFERALRLFFRYYGDNLVDRTRLYPGVREGLDALHDNGIKLGIVTNKPARFTLPILARLGIDHEFDVVVAGDTLDQKKPHPAPLLYAANGLGIRPSRIVMVGDSMNDVLVAWEAGMAIVFVPYGYNHGSDIFDAQPDAVIDSLADLVPLLGGRP
jgi:phosphoglycolate phosphatase